MHDTLDRSTLAQSLHPQSFPHAVEQVEIRETHISWIVLTGEYAYKIKKPVDLGFVDFSTRERRHFFCQEEIRLNGRYSDDLYLDVVPIAQCDEGLRFGGQGSPLEYAVQMRQFDERHLLSQLLADGLLESSHIDDLATTVAVIHAAADRVEDQSEWGTAQQIGQPAFENISALEPIIQDADRKSQLEKIADWTRQEHQRLTEVFIQRRHNQFIRECHGDLHLGNVVVWRKEVTPFDCIEFNPAFRWIDVMSEVAFVVMDLDDHQRADLGWRFLNAYLERTGDYRGLPVLPFSLAYRAMVRTKVGALRSQQPGMSPKERQNLNDEWHGYLDLAQQYTTKRSPHLTITHGLSGSGKTTGTQSVVEQQGAIRVRSDVERKRLFDREMSRHSEIPVDTDIYSPAATDRTYDVLADRARAVIQAGYPVIIDATFLRRAQRNQFRKLADELGVPFQILAFEADEQELKQRIQHRAATSNDASDATLEVLEHQRQTCEPLTDEERTFVVSCGGD